MGKEIYEVRTLGAELRSEGDGRTIIGHAAVFNTWSAPICGWFREMIDPAAFTNCDMSDTIACFNHNADILYARTISGTLKLTPDDTGLRFEFDMPETTAGNDMLVMIKRGDIKHCSFRFTVKKDSWKYADSPGEDNKLDERVILEFGELKDVALVVFPAYKDTDVSVRHLEERKADFLGAQEPAKHSNEHLDREMQFINLTK